MKPPDTLAINQNYAKWVLLVLSAAIVLFASTYKLSEAPAVWSDEGLYTQAAMNLAEHGTQGLQTAPDTFVSNAYLTVGYPLFFPVSLSYRLFGVGVTQGRAVMVFFIIAFVTALYFFMRMLTGSWYAAWAILLMASFPVLYGNGKPVLGEVPGMFFLVLTCIALLKLERSNFKSLWAYIAAGIAAGLCIATKPIFLLLLPAVLLVWLINYRRIELRWDGFFMAVVVFLIPVFLWAYLQFGGEGTILKQLEYYVGSPYVIDNRVGLAIANFKQFFTDIKSIYSVTVPLIFWCLSIFLRKRKGIEVSNSEFTLLVFCGLVLLHFLTIENHSRYFFLAQLAALPFLPYSLSELLRYLRDKYEFIRRFFWSLYALMTTLIAVLVLLQLYFLERNSYVAGYYQSHNTAELAAAFGSLDPKSSIFLYDANEVALFIPSRNYYQYIDAATDLKIGADQLPVLRDGRTEYVVVLPATYENNPELFTKYTKQSQVGKYLLLVKRGRG